MDVRPYDGEGQRSNQQGFLTKIDHPHLGIRGHPLPNRTGEKSRGGKSSPFIEKSRSLRNKLTVEFGEKTLKQASLASKSPEMISGGGGSKRKRFPYVC